jgi:flagellar biogenesis protein FliO
LLSETGTGIGNFFGSIQTAVIALILALTLIGVVVYVVRKLGDGVGKHV